MKKQPIEIGSVLYVEEACLPSLVVIEFFPDGDGYEGDTSPTYLVRPLMPLCEFSEADKQAGLPGCHFVRDGEWLWRNEEMFFLEGDGDLVLTERILWIRVSDPEEFSDKVHVIGKVSPTALRAVQKKILELILNEDSFSSMKKEDLLPRVNFQGAIDFALESWSASPSIT
ncbi:MAG: hypothetical protein IPN70_05105 [Candidatus Moraniibacteriota bacterium]|nr:MAG: hypothetical protein IPN70_05105 [Candidatus Moranbacteria bacterium]